MKFFGDFLFVLSNNDNIGAVLIDNNLFSFLAKSNIADTTFPSKAVLYVEVKFYKAYLISLYDSGSLESIKRTITDS